MVPHMEAPRLSPRATQQSHGSHSSGSSKKVEKANQNDT